MLPAADLCLVFSFGRWICSPYRFLPLRRFLLCAAGRTALPASHCLSTHLLNRTSVRWHRHGMVRYALYLGSCLLCSFWVARTAVFADNSGSLSISHLFVDFRLSITSALSALSARACGTGRINSTHLSTTSFTHCAHIFGQFCVFASVRWAYNMDRCVSHQRLHISISFVRMSRLMV